MEQERLLYEIETLTNENKKRTQQEFKEIVSTFEKMSAKTAAPIISK